MNDCRLFRFWNKTLARPENFNWFRVWSVLFARLAADHIYSVRSVLRYDEMTNRAVRPDREMQFAERPSSPLPDDLSLSLSHHICRRLPWRTAARRFLAASSFTWNRSEGVAFILRHGARPRPRVSSLCGRGQVFLRERRARLRTVEVNSIRNVDEKMQPSPPGISQWRAHFLKRF